MTYQGLDKTQISHDIKHTLNDSKDFVNIFLGFTPNMSDDERATLFEKILNNVARTITG